MVLMSPIPFWTRRKNALLVLKGLLKVYRRCSWISNGKCYDKNSHCCNFLISSLWDLWTKVSIIILEIFSFSSGSKLFLESLLIKLVDSFRSSFYILIPSPFPSTILKGSAWRASNPILNLPKPDISCESKLIFERPPPRKGNRGFVAVWWRLLSNWQTKSFFCLWTCVNM